MTALYRFAVVCTQGENNVQVNNFVMVFAFNMRAARMHKTDCETAYVGFTFAIKPVRKESDGSYTILD